MKNQFTVSATVDLGHFIGVCQIEVVADASKFIGDGYFEIISVSNKFGDEATDGQIEAMQQDSDLMGEIAYEVQQHFVCQFEAMADAAEDR